jgi:hypothetical protein
MNLFWRGCFAIVWAVVGCACGAVPVWAGADEAAWEAANRDIRAALDRDDLPRAGRSAEEALRIARDAFGPAHMKTAVALRRAAEVRRLQGKTREASEALQEAAALWDRNLGASHPYAASLLVESAENLEAAEDYAAAVQVRTRVVDAQKKYYGPGHTAAAAALLELAAAQEKASRPEAARKSRAEAAEILAAALGPAHPRTLDALARGSAGAPAE